MRIIKTPEDHSYTGPAEQWQRAISSATFPPDGPSVAIAASALPNCAVQEACLLLNFQGEAWGGFQ